MVRLLKTSQYLIASVILIMLNSCTAPDLRQTDDSAENLASESIPPAPLETQADASILSDDASPPPPPQSTSPIDPTETATQQSPSAAQSFTETDPSSASSSQRVSITIYRIDSFCQDFIPEPIRVDPDRAIEQAIGKVLEAEDNSQFELAGYRVKIDAASGLATVDLRVSPNSPRKIVSLSNCEQLALFGSLRETLLGNPEWNIETVRFTERGQEIVL